MRVKKKGLRVNSEPSIRHAHSIHCSVSPSGPKLPSEACWQWCPSCYRSSWFPSRWGHRWYSGRTLGSEIGHLPKVNLSRTSVFPFCTDGALDWTALSITPPSGRVDCTRPCQKAYLHTLAFDTPCEREESISLTQEQIATCLPVENCLTLSQHNEISSALISEVLFC